MAFHPSFFFLIIQAFIRSKQTAKTILWLANCGKIERWLCDFLLKCFVCFCFATVVKNSCEEKLLGEISKLMFLSLRPIGATCWRPFIKLCSVCTSLFSAIVLHNERYNIAKGTIDLKVWVFSPKFLLRWYVMTYIELDQNLASNYLTLFLVQNLD